MQRNYVAALLLAACGIFMSSCDLIFRKNQKPLSEHNFMGSWVVSGDSTLQDSIFNQPVTDSIGIVYLTFGADSLLSVKKADSVILQTLYYQNNAGDTLYVRQDSILTVYPVLWNSDSSLSLQQTDKLFTLIKQ